MAAASVKYTYRVSGISERDANHVGVSLVQQEENLPVGTGPGQFPPMGGPLTAWVVVVPKDKAADFLPGDTYTVTFTKN